MDEAKKTRRDPKFFEDHTFLISIFWLYLKFPVWVTFFDHSIFITHHSSLITLNTKVVWYHHPISITHYFSHYLGAPHLSQCSFFFFQYLETRTQWKKKSQWRRKKKKKTSEEDWTQWRRKGKKKKETSEDRTQWRRREKKKPSEDWTSEKEEEKKSQLVKRCGWVGPSCVFNYKNAIELWVMETKNWKLSYGLPNKLFLRIEMGLTIFENWVMKTKNWVMRIDEPNSPSFSFYNVILVYIFFKPIVILVFIIISFIKNA